MALTVTHQFVSLIPDDPAAVAAGEVVPSNWNAAHVVTGGESDGPEGRVQIADGSGGFESDTRITFAGLTGVFKVGDGGDDGMELRTGASFSNTFEMAAVGIDPNIVIKMTPQGTAGFQFAAGGLVMEAPNALPGAYTLANSGVLMRNAAGTEIWRLWGTDPDDGADFNSANLYVGRGAGAAQPTDNTTAGYSNTGLGASALASIGVGFANTAVGTSALFSVTNGHDNFALGSGAASSITSGAGNAAVGTSTLLGIVTGVGNTAVGRFSGPASDMSNTTAIGDGAVPTASNTAVIGNSGLTDVYCGSPSAAANIHAANLVNLPTVDIAFVIDGGGSAITTGVKGDLEIPFPCTIVRATLLADQTGSAVVDIWKAAYASFPPTAGNSITSATPPTLASAQKSQDSTLTGWTTSIVAGDTLRYNVNSASTVTRLTLSLKVTKS